MVIDFNAHSKPYLNVRLRGEDAPQIRVNPPSVDLADALLGAADALSKIVVSDSADQREALYIYAAQLMSRNRELIPITAEDLRGKYDISIEDLVYFFSTYTDFLDSIRSQKN